MGRSTKITVGVLALQGSFLEHLTLLRKAADFITRLRNKEDIATLFDFIKVYRVICDVPLRLRDASMAPLWRFNSVLTHTHIRTFSCGRISMSRTYAVCLSTYSEKNEMTDVNLGRCCVSQHTTIELRYRRCYSKVRTENERAGYP